MRYAYRVKRWVLEEYAVEITAEQEPTRQEVLDTAHDPARVFVGARNTNAIKAHALDSQST